MGSGVSENMRVPAAEAGCLTWKLWWDFPPQGNQVCAPIWAMWGWPKGLLKNHRRGALHWVHSVCQAHDKHCPHEPFSPHSNPTVGFVWPDSTDKETGLGEK